VSRREWRSDHGDVSQLLSEHGEGGNIRPAVEGTVCDIARMGYEAVVSLAMHDSEGAIPDEGSIVAGLEMSYFHIPVPFEGRNETHRMNSVSLSRFFATAVTINAGHVVSCTRTGRDGIVCSARSFLRGTESFLSGRIGAGTVAGIMFNISVLFMVGRTTDEHKKAGAV